MKTYAIAAIPGDGIGTEVVSAGVEVLAAVARREGRFAFKVDRFDWGGEYYKKHGRMMPENGRELIRRHDAILFGSAGHPEIP
ncbi:MAG: tartrate dehydrogenase, partial [Alphaproteobacteria bacterium]|nr:tartrate dehydrogenase [Alphaproteobacteria bacterium]